MRTWMTALAFVAAITLGPSLARAAAQPAETPAAPSAAPADAPAAPATTVAEPASPKYGALPGVLLGVGILVAAGGTTAVLLEEDALGYTGVCLGSALTLAGVALLVDRASPAKTAAADDDGPDVQALVVPALGDGYVGVAGALRF